MVPLVGGQWVSAGNPHFNLLIVNNRIAGEIPVQAGLKPLAYTAV